MRWNPYCWVRGHRWLFDLPDTARHDFVCMTDVCLRCAARRTIHARIADKLTTKGIGGCHHGTPGEVTPR